MRALFLLFLASFLSASSFPQAFSSVGDEIYGSMQQYKKIKDLNIYQDRPELLEAFCQDANSSMQEGFVLDKIEDDPELPIDKDKIKAYAKSLRGLSRENEKIKVQIQRDIQVLLEAKEYKSLHVFEEAGFVMSIEVKKAFAQEKRDEKALVKKRDLDKNIAFLKQKQEQKKPEKIKTIASLKEVEIPKNKIETPVKPEIQEVYSIPYEEPEVVEVKPLSELERYQQSLKTLKEELYALRETGEEQKMRCLNDITAINYWIIKVLEEENNACALVDSIKQMKSYDKSASVSCGRTSMRYVEWHGRIKPYVGSKLFKAESLCSR